MPNPTLLSNPLAKLPPWLQPLWDSLEFNSFPNAILLYGQSGTGKFDFAIQLSKALLCEEKLQTESKPCNHCEACHWFDSGNHPDFLPLVPETHGKFLPHSTLEAAEDSSNSKRSKSGQTNEALDSTEKKEKKNISIDDVRSSIEGLSIGAHRGGNRVVLIYPMEMLRADAANTLLKSLEEPIGQTIFILVADRLDRVLPTIRSRCRLLAAPRPERQVGLDWLNYTLTNIDIINVSQEDLGSIYDEQGGAPYAARKLVLARHNKDEKDEAVLAHLASRQLLNGLAQGGNINWLELAEKVHKAPFSVLLMTQQRWIADLEAVCQTGNVRYFPKQSAILKNLSSRVEMGRLLRFWKNLLRARAYENHPLATRIQMEALLLEYKQLFQA